MRGYLVALKVPIPHETIDFLMEVFPIEPVSAVLSVASAGNLIDKEADQGRTMRRRWLSALPLNRAQLNQ